MTGSLPIGLVAYRLGTGLLSPLAPALLTWRARQGKEDLDRLSERLGRAQRARPPGDLVWLHGASVGETQTLLPLVEALVARGLPVLVTSGTRTSASLLERRLPPKAFHQYVPLDLPRAVARFLDSWKPSVALFAESEIWPNLVLAIRRRGIPLLLLNGRMSERSFRGWGRAPTMARALFGSFTACLAQTEADAERLAALGASVAGAVGNLKFDAPPLPADPAEVESLAALLIGRPIWMAASTHPGEEAQVFAAHLALKASRRDLLTILAPRHPARGEEVAELADGMGLRVSRRSRGERPAAEDDIHLVDTIGELGAFYRLAPLVFMGGSLVRHGGQNPIEPVRLGAAVLHGPHVANFAEIYGTLDDALAAASVPDGTALAQKAGELIADGARVRDMARRGRAVVERLSGALARTLALIDPYVTEPARRAAAQS